MRLENNQRIVIINPHSREDIGCRVVQVEGPRSALYEVAFEFDRRNPRFWPIDFLPEDWAVNEEIASEDH